ncbi:MAG: hypothetical protein JNM76_18260 [Betaproteobacteria bacterium]|nr:hypothetical protein [Betaproteobacteria bacterium]
MHPSLSQPSAQSDSERRINLLDLTIVGICGFIVFLVSLLCPGAAAAQAHTSALADCEYSQDKGIRDLARVQGRAGEAGSRTAR